MKSSSPGRQPSLKEGYIMVVAGFVLAPLYATYVVETNNIESVSCPECGAVTRIAVDR